MPQTDTLYADTMDTPVGTLTIVAGADGLRAVLWPGEDLSRVRIAGTITGTNKIIEMAREQLEEYFAGTRSEFDVPLAPEGTAFQKAAWQALTAIPYGSTTTYGEQARRLGDVRKTRAVGAANGRNPISIIVPCHRVVGADGSLTGFAAGVATKAWLLDHERTILATRTVP